MDYYEEYEDEPDCAITEEISDPYPDDYYEKMVACYMKMKDYIVQNNLKMMNSPNTLESMFKLCNLRIPVTDIEEGQHTTHFISLKSI